MVSIEHQLYEIECRLSNAEVKGDHTEEGYQLLKAAVLDLSSRIGQLEKSTKQKKVNDAAQTGKKPKGH